MTRVLRIASLIYPIATALLRLTAATVRRIYDASRRKCVCVYRNICYLFIYFLYYLTLPFIHTTGRTWRSHPPPYAPITDRIQLLHCTFLLNLSADPPTRFCNLDALCPVDGEYKTGDVTK